MTTFLHYHCIRHHQRDINFYQLYLVCHLAKHCLPILNKVPFHLGINVHIIENLKHQVKKLIKIDKSCILFFDEMASDLG